MMRATLPLLLALLAGPALAGDASAPAADSRPTLSRVDYQCAAGIRLSVAYPPPELADAVPIRVIWQGKRYRLVPAASASGARYASRQLEWCSRGDEGMLSRYRGKALARDCRPLADGSR
ncbi:hypothetical protein CEK28_17160 [Xenophilus sp. AP218F]|nr:hypothetical protein CEK28_17160 [Xenophilus sp. AP218F]